MKDLPRVNKLSDVKITKIKPFVIMFKIKDKHYLLHESGECGEYSTCLMYRELNENGFWKLDYVKSNYGSLDVNDFIRMKNQKTFKHSIIYKDIDISRFVYKLTYKGFITSLYDKEVEQNKAEVKKLEEEISLLNNIICEKRQQIRNLS